MQCESRILVSVVITAFNAEEYLAETLQSVSAQTYSPLEIIVVDDGSSDGTADVVKGCPNAQYVYQKNSGQPSARNAGIRQASGKYIAFVDSDDLWLPEKIAKQVSALEHSGGAWCYCDCLHFENTPDQVLYRYSSLVQPHQGHVIEPLLLGNFIPSPTPMIRRDVLFTVGLWDDSCAIAEDWNMWLKIAAKFPIEYVDEPLAAYRRHSGNMLQGLSVEAILEGNLAVLESGFGHLPTSNPRLLARAHANLFFKIGLAYLKRGKAWEGRRMLSKALRSDPYQSRFYSFLAASLLPTGFVQALNKYRHFYCRIEKPITR